MKAFVQNEAGSAIKRLHNEKTFARTGALRVARAYPFPYGFILGTTAEDGLNVDCFFITARPLRTGQIIDCEPIGLMEQIEDGKTDHNLLVVPRGEKQRLNGKIAVTLVLFVTHVFDYVPAKRLRAGNFLGRETALRHISRHRDLGLGKRR